MPVLTTLAAKGGIYLVKKLVLMKFGKVVLNEVLGEVIKIMVEKGLLKMANDGNHLASRALYRFYNAEIQNDFDGDVLHWIFDKTGGDVWETIQVVGLVFGIDL